jgi:hypothetical protein
MQLSVPIVNEGFTYMIIMNNYNTLFKAAVNFQNQIQLSKARKLVIRSILQLLPVMLTIS